MRILAAVVLLALGGLAVGGVAQVIASDDDTSPVSAAITLGAVALDCSSGEVLDTYQSGSRVYAFARTDDGVFHHDHYIDVLHDGAR